jgi:cold shock CspA family protein
MSTGTAKRFNRPSGFDVTVDDAEGDELVVHRGSLAASDATLAPDNRVEFEIHADGMGAQMARRGSTVRVCQRASGSRCNWPVSSA